MLKFDISTTLGTLNADLNPDYTGSDLVTLQPFMDYIEDPDLLKTLMED